MGNYTKQDIIQLVEEKDVQFIRLQFTDVSGTLKNVAITASQLEKALDNKCMFDGSSIEGFVRIEESDMYLYRILIHLRFFRGVHSMAKLPVSCAMYIDQRACLSRETAVMY